MRIYRLEEADKKKARFINSHPNLGDDEKEYLLNLYLKPEVPDNIINWQKIKDLSFDTLKDIAENFLKDREEKKNKKNLSKAIEGRDYIKIFENTNDEGTEYLYLPLTWIGSKYLASDHFLPKIKVPSKVMEANDFADNSARNEDLSPGAKWCISLWTLPDCVVDGEIVTDGNGKELRHEGKRYWLGYTSGGYYFLFYFRDYSNLDDINKKIALTLSQGSSYIEDVTLADDTPVGRTPDINRIQEYWDRHYKEYESRINHIQEVSTKGKPEFDEYEKQKEKEAKKYLKFQRREYILRRYFTYNESTGRYDSKGDVARGTLQYLIDDGEFTVPIGIINGSLNCGFFKLKTLVNGPTEVKGSFYCFNNNLTTLEGAPKKVGGSFNCSDNKLTSLEYAPQKVEGNFSCFNNKLTTLKYAPEYVGGWFNCSYNNLKTLEGAPEKVEGNFNCSNNNLATLEYAPKEVGGGFDCCSNRLITLEYAPKEVRGDFYCRGNSLQSDELSTEVKGIVYY